MDDVNVQGTVLLLQVLNMVDIRYRCLVGEVSECPSSEGQPRSSSLLSSGDCD